MSYEEGLNKLLKEQELNLAEEKKLSDEWDRLDEEIEVVDSRKGALETKIKNYREKNFEDGYEQWKSTLENNGESVVPYTFKLSVEETLKAMYLGTLYKGQSGAIGGGATYEFTPTSIGEIATLVINKKEYTLTDYTNF